MRIVIAEQDKVKKYHLGVATVLGELGKEGRLVTDRSTLDDFLDNGYYGVCYGECAPDYRLKLIQLHNLSHLARRKVSEWDYVWEVGKWIEGE